MREIKQCTLTGLMAIVLLMLISTRSIQAQEEQISKLADAVYSYIPGDG